MNDLIDFVEAHGGALCGESRDKLVRLVQAESAARERVTERAHAEAIEQWKAAEGKLKQANARMEAMPCYLHWIESWTADRDPCECPRCEALRDGKGEL